MNTDIKFTANDKADLHRYELCQGDSLKISARVPVTSFSSEPLPVVKFFAIDTVTPEEASQTIGPKDFTVTLNETLTTIDLKIVLAPGDTSSLILDSSLGRIQGLQQNEPRYSQPAKRFFYEIQVTGLGVNRSYQGHLIVYTDFIKLNTSGTLPGLT